MKNFLKFISYFVWLYIGFIFLWLVSRFIFFDRIWWLALINTVALYLFIPLILLLPFSIISRQWKLLFGLCFPLGIFMAFWIPLFLPNTPVIASNNSFNIQVMSFNMLFSNNDFNNIKKMVENNSPDIIGLQEVFPTKADKIKKLFTSEYPYQAFRPFKNYHTHNVALLSKFPIIKITVLTEEKIERGLLVTLDIGNQKQINALVTHLYPNYPSHKFLKLAKIWYSRRLAQTLYLRKVIKSLNLPTVMMCDCNFTETSEAYSIIKSVMDDSFYQAGWGFGHSFKTPLFPIARIDYIWHTKEFRAINASVSEDAGSDHLPVSAKLNLSK